MKPTIVARYSYLTPDRFREELRIAKKEMIAVDSEKFLTHSQEQEKLYRQQRASYKFAEMLQYLRYCAGERATLPTPVSKESDRV